LSLECAELKVKKGIVKKIKMYKKYLLSLLIMTMFIVSCSHSSKKPGNQYFNDMNVSLAYETYSDNPVFKDGKTNQLPVAGTIARGKMPYNYGAKSADEQTRAGKELINPTIINETTLAKGKAQFTIYCAICHGTEGKGDGTLHTSGKFTSIPADLTSERIRNFPDGEIFHVITRGSITGLMGSHATQINPQNRWMIVDYIKNGFSVKAKSINNKSSKDGK
jgi:mono/diheme cytochrome c family protein